MFSALRRFSTQLASSSARALAPEVSPVQARGFSASSLRQGIEEFFGERRAWEASDLRTKADEDLHKLWYVLLKEKNALQTERFAARAQRERFANPYRLRKVKNSMARLKTVLNERMRAAAPDPERLLQYKLQMRERLMATVPASPARAAAAGDGSA